MAKKSLSATYRVVVFDKKTGKTHNYNLAGYLEIAGAEFSNNGAMEKRFFPKELQKFDDEKKDFESVPENEAKKLISEALGNKTEKTPPKGQKN